MQTLTFWGLLKITYLVAHLVPVIILITYSQLNLLSALKELYFYGAAGED